MNYIYQVLGISCTAGVAYFWSISFTKLEGDWLESDPRHRRTWVRSCSCSCSCSSVGKRERIFSFSSNYFPLSFFIYLVAIGGMVESSMFDLSLFKRIKIILPPKLELKLVGEDNEAVSSFFSSSPLFILASAFFCSLLKMDIHAKFCNSVSWSAVGITDCFR